MSQTVIITLLSPLMIAIGGLISWFFKSKREDLLISEERTRDFKIKTYDTLLQPVIAAFSFTLNEKQKNKEIDKLHSLEYRKAVFNLTTFGSDQVVKSYNNLMQAFFNINSEDFSDDNSYSLVMLKSVSDLMLNIRKDLYSKKTKLKHSEMLEFMITDINKHQDTLNK